LTAKYSMWFGIFRLSSDVNFLVNYLDAN